MIPRNDTPYKIQRIYLKSASVEVPHMGQLSGAALSPQIGVDMNTEAHGAGTNTLECVLRISLHARAEGMNVFMLEVCAAGVFELPVLQQHEVTRFVRQVAPSVLFPFARKDLAALAVAAGFQPILLDHIDFDALLTQVINRHRASTQAQAGSSILSALQTRTLPVKKQEPSAPPAPPTPPTPPTAPAAPSPTPVPKPPVVQPAPAVQAPPAPAAEDWLDTAPQPFDLPPTPAPASAKKRRGKGVALVVLVAGLAAWLLWPTHAPVAPPFTGQMAGPAGGQPAAQAAGPVTAPAAKAPAPLAAATLQALQHSSQRLSEQPPTHYSVELGTLDAHADLSALDALALQYPLYLEQTADKRMRLLYGSFPKEASAQAALAQTRQWSVPGLVLQARVTTFGQK